MRREIYSFLLTRGLTACQKYTGPRRLPCWREEESAAPKRLQACLRRAEKFLIVQLFSVPDMWPVQALAWLQWLTLSCSASMDGNERRGAAGKKPELLLDTGEGSNDSPQHLAAWPVNGCTASCLIWQVLLLSLQGPLYCALPFKGMAEIPGLQ